MTLFHRPIYKHFVCYYTFIRGTYTQFVFLYVFSKVSLFDRSSMMLRKSFSRYSPVPALNSILCFFGYLVVQGRTPKIISFDTWLFVEIQ